MVLIAGREAAAFHIDQPRGLAGRRHDEVETLERAIRDQAAARLIDRDVRQLASAKIRFERGFVMVVAVHG